MRKFDRQILTAQIDKETADANIIASGNIKIDLDKDLTNHYSKIKAGKNLTVCTTLSQRIHLSKA
ncbi:hypothetical protein [Phascolarctobacterium succinatutens]|uniref:hypothetical protein n=1 Tax=Phascolarctobacterium succinatutens TaxID=626940 RepID=UPI0025F2DE41|nr:hypothetical protein [Phascolarctobacterium succinatutens]